MLYVIAAVFNDGARLFKSDSIAYSTWQSDINLAKRFEYQGLTRSLAESDSLARDTAAVYVLENDGLKVDSVFQAGKALSFRPNLFWEELNK